VNLLQFCLLSLAGRIEENQQHLIEYLQAEIQVLGEQLGSSHVHFAAEHAITVEALVEMIESDLSGDASSPPEGELDADFRRRVIEKVKAFSKRPITETHFRQFEIWEV
jgi:hypothetical protein